MKKPAKPANKPLVYKEEELAQMIELIGNGVWRTTNLANALHIDRETVDKWKEFKEVKDAHRQAVNKYSRRRNDNENILKELGMEVDAKVQEMPIIQVVIEDYGIKDNPPAKAEGGSGNK